MRRSVLALAAGAVGLVGLWLLWPTPPPARPPRARVHEARVAKSPAPATAGVVPAEAELPPQPARLGTAEAAVRAVAELAGEGVVRCPLGDTVPDGPVAGIPHAWVEDAVLVAAVDEPQGDARITLPEDGPVAPPLVVVRWWDAWPGETGVCDVVRPERVPVAGRVVDPEGRPVVGAEVGNPIDGVTVSGPGGRFAVTCWLGASCAIAARPEGTIRWGPAVAVPVDGPLHGVQVVLAEPADVDLRTWLEERVDEDLRRAAAPDPLALALEAGGELSAAAREIVASWLDAEHELVELSAAALADIREE